MVRPEAWQREPFPRQHPWQQERLPTEGHVDDGRQYHAAPDARRGPLIQPIDKALREHCNISASHYFVAVILDDGSPAVFAGPGRGRPNLIPKFFDQDRFVRYIQMPETATSPMLEEPDFGFDSMSDYSTRRPNERRRNDMADGMAEMHMYKGRKRARGFRHGANDDDDQPPPVTSTKKGIKIGNSKEVWDFYEQRFKNCQQTACKLIAKAWVKAVEPKKQSNHPYTGSDEKAPDWWPKPWGLTKDDKVRHKEPDHLYKRERVHLLNHILRMVVEPNHKQHVDIQKLNLNVKKLREITTEALSTFFADKDQPLNAKKKPYLNEIFRVAEFEERFKNGEIDGTTEVYVMADDKIPDNYQSENDDGLPTREEDEQQANSVSSDPKTGPPHGLLAPTSTDHSPAGNLHGGPFMEALPVRSSHYAPHMMTSDLATEHHHFVDGVNMVGGQAPLHTNGGMTLQVPSEIMPSPHDTSRRPSLFNSPTDYASPAGTTAMYAPPWQPSTTAPTMTSMYAFTPQQPPGQTFVSQPGVGIPQSQQGMRADGLPPSGNFEHLISNNNPFRQSSLPPAPVPQGPTYPHYLQHDGRQMAGTGVKVEGLGRGGALH